MKYMTERLSHETDIPHGLYLYCLELWRLVTDTLGWVIIWVISLSIERCFSPLLLLPLTTMYIEVFLYS